VPLSKIPPFILIFFIIDLGLGAAHIIDYLSGRPYWLLSRLIDLGQEGNIPQWYSSVQWFTAAALLGIFAYYNFYRFRLRSWLLLALPLVFLAFSMDEVAMIHERLGRNTDVVLPGGSRQDNVFFRTGVWMFVMGLPFIALFAALVFSVRVYFRRAAGPLKKMLLGVAVFLGGALGSEAFSNFVIDFDSAYGVLQVVSEEVCEMLGSTIVLWGSFELLQQQRFTLRLDEVQID
jgi:hypothetical protein